LATPSNGLFINASDFKQDPVGTVPKPLRLDCQKPAPLLLIQPTQQQIHVPVVLTAKMGFIASAGAAPAFMDGLSWHTSVSSPSAGMPALYALRPLDRKTPNPEVVFLQALSCMERRAAQQRACDGNFIVMGESEQVSQ